jgi:signal transduction histidine kinase
MDHLHKLTRQTRDYVFLVALVFNVSLIAAYVASTQLFGLNAVSALILVIVLAILLALIGARAITGFALQPVRYLWQAILHVSPGHSNIPAPNLEEAKVGRELVTSLCLQVYQLASVLGETGKDTGSENAIARTVAHSLPVPLFVLDKEQVIRFANEAALQYVRQKAPDVIGKNVYAVLDLSFPSTQTFDVWLKDCQANKATAANRWDRVRFKLPGDSGLLQFDMAAYYNKDNPNGVETIITLFDHSAEYGQDDQAIGFVAMAVHELRTPLTLLRGYIEVFEEEFQGKLNQELSGFMNKMQASAENLSAFVNNILNVARVEESQLELKLSEEKWEDIVRTCVSDMNLRAQVHQKSIVCEIAPRLPTAAVDRVSISEVINNLLDNAIKYSGESPQIVIRTAVNNEGLIETNVQDKGIGIPGNITSKLFDKFYRNHRSRGQIGGTGLGLYLSKVIVGAHGGNIWVQSKEGQGSTFSFTVKPYSMLADEQKSGNNDAIRRSAHGWIKNHAMYRR